MKNFFSEYKTAIKWTLIAGLAYAVGVALSILYGYRITGIEVLLPCLIGVAGIVFYKAFAACESLILFDKNTGAHTLRREVITAFVFGTVFALTLVVGGRIDFYANIFNDFELIHIAVFPFLSLFFSAVVLLLFAFRDYVSRKDCTNCKDDTNRKNDTGRPFMKHLFFILWGVNLICYLPYYLTFFPGNCGNDTWLSLYMITGDAPWTNHHPVLFTGLIMLVVKATGFLGSMTASVGVFSFLQMVSFAAVLAYLTVWICKKNVQPVIKVLTVLFCAFHPFMGMYSIYLSKDVLFSEIMILLILNLYDVVEKKGEVFSSAKNCTQIGVLFLLSCMLRNNGVYISIVMAVCFLLLYRKYRKQILLIFICVLGLFQLWQGPVFSAIGIEKQSFAEAASVPLQQIGYVLWEGKTFSEDDMAFLEELMPIETVKEVYQPGFTDPYKFHEEFDHVFLNSHVGEFLKVWARGLVPYFPEYVKAYLHQTLGYWYYGATNTVCTQGCTANTLGVEQIDVIKQATGISFEPVMEALVLAGRKAPVICILGSMAMQMFMVCMLLVCYVRTGRKEKCLCLIPLLILWGTIMIATPAFCLLRYLFPIFLLWPFLIAEFFACREAEQQDQKAEF